MTQDLLLQQESNVSRTFQMVLPWDLAHLAPAEARIAAIAQ